MGQKSLPRLEKIQNSMSWESSIFEKQNWLGPKTFLTYKLFSQYLLKKRMLPTRIVSKNSKLKKLRLKLFLPTVNPVKRPKNYYVLGSYVFQLNNLYYSTILYYEN